MNPVLSMSMSKYNKSFANDKTYSWHSFYLIDVYLIKQSLFNSVLAFCKK